MRNLLKPAKLSLLLVVLLAGALAFTGCPGNGNGGGGGGADVFTATVPGFTPWPAYPSPQGSITARVTLSADRETIVAISVTSTENEPFRSATNPRIPDAIVEHQSINIDRVSGATATSNAIIQAVSTALMQAGPEVLANFSAAPVIAANDPSTITVDVLVVGSGVAGLAAAIEAAYLGADVLVIEKLGFLGGVTATSGGMIHGANSVVMRQRTGSIFQGDTADTFAEELIDLSLDLPVTNTVREPLLRAIADLSTDTIDWLITMGIQFPAGTNELGLTGNPSRAWRGTPFARALTPTGSGREMMARMIAYAGAQGVEFMIDTRAVTLRGGASGVTGVNAVDITGAAVTINAGSVILATGGFHNNDVLLRAHHPNASDLGADHIRRWNLPGAEGQGLTMAETIGAGILDLPTPIAGLTGNPAWGIWVTPEGDRFFDESWQYGIASAAELGRLGFYYHWTIMNDADRPAGLVAGANVFTGTDLADLVDNMPAAYGAEFLANLQAAIDAYNDALEAGDPVPFASPLGIDGVFAPGAATPARPRHVAIDDAGVLWAQRSGVFGDIWGTNSGLSINQSGQVLTGGGGVIPGLFAAGEVVGWILPVQYGGSGMAITIWTNQARITGRAAAQ